MSEYDLDVVQAGDIVRFETAETSIRGKVTGNYEFVGRGIWELVIHDKTEDIHYVYHYTDDEIGLDTYGIELVRWNDE